MAGCQENPTRTKRNVRNTATAIGREEAESEPGPVHLFPTCPQPVSEVGQAISREDHPSVSNRARTDNVASGKHGSCCDQRRNPLFRSRGKKTLWTTCNEPQ